MAIESILKSIKTLTESGNTLLQINVALLKRVTDLESSEKDLRARVDALEQEMETKATHYPKLR